LVTACVLPGEKSDAFVCGSIAMADY